MTEVVAGLLVREDAKILIWQRRIDQPHPLKWEFPGGKIEQGETPQTALTREIREELGIESEPAEEITRYQFAYPGKDPIQLIFLAVTRWTGEIREGVWESPNRLAQYDFLEGDQPFIVEMTAEQSTVLQRIFNRNNMPQTTNSTLGQILSLLAGKGYAVTQTGPDGLRIQETDSGIALQAVIQGDILLLSLLCATVPAAKITQLIMRKMLASDNGISTSNFQLHDSADGNVTVTLNNFCKLQGLGVDDEDDILSCVSFLLADVVHAKELIGHDLQ